MGRGGSHETDPYPCPQSRATRRFGGSVPYHPQRAFKNTRTQMVLLAAERHLTAAQIAETVRIHLKASGILLSRPQYRR